jgi:predicted metal-dependent hydrolase
VQLHLPFLESPDPQAREARPRPVDNPQQAVEFVRVRTARRYILRIRPDGTLRVTVPRGGSRREAEQFVLRHQRWIARERGRALVEHAPRAWQHGSEILLNGEPVCIRVEQREDQTVITFGPRRIVTRKSADVRTAIEHDLRSLAKTELVARLHVLAAEHGLKVGKVSIRNQRSRWGSCARNGNIALNFRLVQMPPGVRDYVLLHELMHMKQQNHSPKFWRLVEGVYPAFREAERWLRTTGKSLF